MNAEDPEYPEEYYEHLARILGQEQADWARLPRAERERELIWLHKHFDTPDDLAEWPPELDGGLHNERLVGGRSLIRREVSTFVEAVDNKPPEIPPPSSLIPQK